MTLTYHLRYNSFQRASQAKHTRTPELTNIGSFEKCWRLIDGKWWLCKTATQEELFSELFVYELGVRLGMNMAVCQRGDHILKSLDFTDAASVNLEHASSFMGDNDDYGDTIRKLEMLCPAAIPDYVRMIFLDTITANPDRHTSNFGLLRNVSTGRILGLAPLFDHNMALISRGHPSLKISNHDFLISLFVDVMENRPELWQYIPSLTKEILADACQAVHVRAKKKYVEELIWNRYQMLLEKLK